MNALERSLAIANLDLCRVIEKAEPKRKRAVPVAKDDVFGSWTVVAGQEWVSSGRYKAKVVCSCGFNDFICTSNLKHSRSTMCRMCAGKLRCDLAVKKLAEEHEMVRYFHSFSYTIKSVNWVGLIDRLIVSSGSVNQLVRDLNCSISSLRIWRLGKLPTKGGWPEKILAHAVEVLGVAQVVEFVGCGELSDAA